jgi:hypothetical protein
MHGEVVLWGKVRACFDTSDVLQLSRAALDDTERRLEEIPADLCAPFNAEAANLEQQLLGIYRTVTLCVRKEEDLDKVAGWWQAMTSVCDEFSGRLAMLSREHPLCGAEIFYDRVLDLRNRCQRLQEMHR